MDNKPKLKPILSQKDGNNNILFKKDDHVGLYKIIRLINRNETGELYLCENTVTSKKYAIRFFSKELTEDPHFVQRFRQAATFLPQYIHPNIVRVHEIKEEEGLFFIVSDYIESDQGHPTTLEEELGMRSRFTESEVRKIAISVCKALYYLHNFPKMPLVHSDLKPSNILLRGDGEVMLTDIHILYMIGIGKFRDLIKKAVLREVEGEKKSEEEKEQKESEIDRTASFLLIDKSKSKRAKDFEIMTTFGKKYLKEIISQPGVLFESDEEEEDNEEDYFSFPTGLYKRISANISSALATFDYMSPEQKSGKPINPQSNIYSLGLIIYKMLTGHKISGNWKLPSTYGCNSAWDLIVLKCLKRKPEERYKNIKELQNTISDIYGHKKKILWFLAITLIILSILFVYLSLQAGSKVNRIVHIFMQDERGDSVKILEEAEKEEAAEQFTSSQTEKKQSGKYVRTKGKWKKKKWTERVSERYKHIKK